MGFVDVDDLSGKDAMRFGKDSQAETLPEVSSHHFGKYSLREVLGSNSKQQGEYPSKRAEGKLDRMQLDE